MLVSYKVIGRNIRAARLRANLTQEQAAERMKISILHFGRLERGERPVSLELLANIALTLNAPFGSLLTGCLVDEPLDLPSSDEPDSTANVIAHLASGCSSQAQRLMVSLCREVAKADKASEL